MVCSRKNTKRSIRKNNNYELRLMCNAEENGQKQQLIKRKSNLYDRYSSESQKKVERRKRTTSGNNRPGSLNISAIQEICMVDIKTQLLDLTKKINRLVETTDIRLNAIESKLNIVQATYIGQQI